LREQLNEGVLAQTTHGPQLGTVTHKLEDAVLYQHRTDSQNAMSSLQRLRQLLDVDAKSYRNAWVDGHVLMWHTQRETAP
jgi:hypothetical protein